jgi:hypothetical protein
VHAELLPKATAILSADVAHIALEMDEHVDMRTCSQCGSEYPLVHGFLYRDGDAWAAYWAELYEDHPNHPEPRALMTIAIGDDWSKGADPSSHAWVQLDARPQGDQIQMRFIDPSGTLDAGTFGNPLSREAALSHKYGNDFLACADQVAYQDSRVSALLRTRTLGGQPL